MLTFTATGFGISAIMPGINFWSRRFFMSLFATLTLCMVAANIDSLVWENPSMATPEKVATYFEYFLLALPMPIFTAYLLQVCGENLKSNAIFRAALVIFIFFFILLGITQFTTFFYYVTPENQFIRGEWHTILMAPMVILPFLNLIGVIRRKNNLPPKYYVAFLIYLLPLTITFLVHSFFFVPMLVFIGVVISTLSMFAIIVAFDIDKYDFTKHFRSTSSMAYYTPLHGIRKDFHATLKRS